MHIPDQLEIWEDSVEKYIDGDMLICAVCKKSIMPYKVEAISAHPYAPPVCPECLKEYIEKKTIDRNE